MTWRRPACYALFASGILALAAAAWLFVLLGTRPSEGFGDLGRAVGALLFLGAAGIPFGLMLFIARGTRMPRWMVAIAVLACVLAMLGAIVMLLFGITNATLFGLAFLPGSGLGLASAARAWHAAARV